MDQYGGFLLKWIVQQRKDNLTQALFQALTNHVLIRCIQCIQLCGVKSNLILYLCHVARPAHHGTSQTLGG